MLLLVPVFLFMRPVLVLMEGPMDNWGMGIFLRDKFVLHNKLFFKVT